MARKENSAALEIAASGQLKVVIEGNAKEIAALVLAVQERREETTISFKTDYVTNALPALEAKSEQSMAEISDRAFIQACKDLQAKYQSHDE